MAKEEGQKGEAKETRAVIDRVEEGGMAVLLAGQNDETQLDVPLALLPDGAADGDHLLITIRLDRAARASAEERIRRLQEELKKQSGTEGKKNFKL